MRIKVRAQRKVHRADIFLLPRNMAENRICAYVQNLGMERGELLPGGVERRQLRRSSGCPVQRMKRQYNVLLAAKIAELHSCRRSTPPRSEEHTSELQSRGHLVCRLLLEKKNISFYV